MLWTIGLVAYLRGKSLAKLSEKRQLKFSLHLHGERLLRAQKFDWLRSEDLVQIIRLTFKTLISLVVNRCYWEKLGFASCKIFITEKAWARHYHFYRTSRGYEKTCVEVSGREHTNVEIQHSHFYPIVIFIILYNPCECVYDTFRYSETFQFWLILGKWLCLFDFIMLSATRNNKPRVSIMYLRKPFRSRFHAIMNRPF